ncbi:MAG TPA: outer membrane protein assembly factor BamE [Arenimonas sp.]|nr:outer membrane protein assembly factor BamE [Arenimonas sp.]
MRPVFSLALASLLLSACSTIYKQPVFQGNLLDKANVEQVAAGMSRQQVFALLGSPSVEDPFHQDRWDYIASQRRDHEATVIKTYTVYFDGDKVVRWEGDYFAEQDAQLAAEMAKFGNLPKDKDKKKR